MDKVPNLNVLLNKLELTFPRMINLSGWRISPPVFMPKVGQAPDTNLTRVEEDPEFYSYTRSQYMPKVDKTRRYNDRGRLDRQRHADRN